MRALTRGIPWLTLFCFFGCTDVAPTNPFDPEAPASIQATGHISGTVILPLCTAASVFGNVEVTGMRPGPDGVLAGAGSDADADEAGTRQVLTISQEGTACPDPQDPPSDAMPSRATFTFDDVSPGPYAIRLRAPGYVWKWQGECAQGQLLPTNDASTVIVPVAVGIGQEITVCPLAIDTPEASNARALLRGRVTLDGAADHWGTLVQLQGTAAVTLSGSGGNYELRVPPGEQTLQFRHEGYGDDQLSITGLVAGEVRDVGD